MQYVVYKQVMEIILIGIDFTSSKDNCNIRGKINFDLTLSRCSLVSGMFKLNKETLKIKKNLIEEGFII